MFIGDGGPTREGSVESTSLRRLTFCLLCPQCNDRRLRDKASLTHQRGTLCPRPCQCLREQPCCCYCCLCRRVRFDFRRLSLEIYPTMPTKLCCAGLLLSSR